MKEIFRAKIAFVFGGVILTMLSLQMPIWWGEYQIRKFNLADDQARVERLEALRHIEFKDLIEYYALIPAIKTVDFGAQAKYVSIMEVKPPAEDIQGGVRLTWAEEIYCDLDPLDGEERYNYYAEAETTSRTYASSNKPIKRSEIGKNDGFFVRKKRPSGETGKMPVIRYPTRDEAPSGADCRLRSGMLMSFEGQVRWIEKYSEVVHVRDLSNE